MGPKARIWNLENIGYTCFPCRWDPLMRPPAGLAQYRQSMLSVLYAQCPLFDGLRPLYTAKQTWLEVKPEVCC